MRLIYDGIEAQQGRSSTRTSSWPSCRARKFESPRGPITIDKATGDIIQNVYIRRVEQRDGVLQNVEIETITDVPAKYVHGAGTHGSPAQPLRSGT